MNGQKNVVDCRATNSARSDMFMACEHNQRLKLQRSGMWLPNMSLLTEF